MAGQGTIFLDEIGGYGLSTAGEAPPGAPRSGIPSIGRQRDEEGQRERVRVMARHTFRPGKGHARRTLSRRPILSAQCLINLQHVPALRDRPDEILPLAEAAFLMKHATAGVAALEILPSLSDALLTYHWPGNIRELEDLARKYLVLQDPGAIAEDLRLRSQRKSQPIPPTSRSGPIRIRWARPTRPPLLKMYRSRGGRPENRRDFDCSEPHQVEPKTGGSHFARPDHKAATYKMKKLGIDCKPVDATSTAAPLQKPEALPQETLTGHWIDWRMALILRLDPDPRALGRFPPGRSNTIG